MRVIGYLDTCPVEAAAQPMPNTERGDTLMLKRTALVLAATTVLAATAFAAGALSSGLKPGESPGAFQVVDVSGPNKGKQLCYRCSYGGAPVVAAFIKPNAPEAEFLVTHIQKLADTHKAQGLKTFVVYMGGPDTKTAIEQLTTSKKINIPVTFLPEGTGAADIGAYQINPEASSTVLMWNKMTVRGAVVNVDKNKWSAVEKGAVDLLK